MCRNWFNILGGLTTPAQAGRGQSTAHKAAVELRGEAPHTKPPLSWNRGTRSIGSPAFHVSRPPTRRVFDGQTMTSVGESSAEGATPSTAATAAPATEDPLFQFNTHTIDIHWWLHARRHRQRAGPSGFALHRPMARRTSPASAKTSRSNDASTWDGTTQMTLKGIRHNMLIHDYVVLARGVCGGETDATELPLQGRGSRLIQTRRHDAFF